MKKKISYHETESKIENGLVMWKYLWDENREPIYFERNYVNEVMFYI